jgi:hypothetical protein
VSEQIYSLSPLTTRPSAHFKNATFIFLNDKKILPYKTTKRYTFRAEDGTRTRDLLITNQLLYQLSYFGIKKRTNPF